MGRQSSELYFICNLGVFGYFARKSSCCLAACFQCHDWFLVDRRQSNPTPLFWQVFWRSDRVRITIARNLIEVHQKPFATLETSCQTKSLIFKKD